MIGTAPEFDAADTQAAIDAAAAAFPSFKNKTGRERSKLLRKWYDLMVCQSTNGQRCVGQDVDTIGRSRIAKISPGSLHGRTANL